MASWEKTEGVPVSASAQDAIASSFEQHNTLFTDFGSNHMWKGSDRTLKQTLVIYYLSNLRDLKSGSESPMMMNENADRMNERRAGNASEMSAFGIEASDVRAYPVEKFLESIQPILKGPNGELHITSDPTGAAITLDKASRGYTEKITLETAGKHRIIVRSKKNSMRCEYDVTIPKDSSVTFHCP